MAKRINQSDKAYKALRNKLLAQSIKPGQRLTEQACAQEFDVNRSDIRQALARLEVEGMVTRGAKGGVFARTYTENDVRQTTYVRMALETAAVQLAINNATPAQLAQLDEIAEHMMMMAENAYDMGFSEADIRFHQCLVEAAHNEALTRTYLLANIPLSMAQPAPHDKIRQQLLQNANEHQQIAQAIRHKNAERAIELLQKGLETLLPQLENRNSSGQKG
ncbi:MAG: GntR family transcriptional regulator [Sedimentisphaerales bacterium]|nr:GntR family transcriptional regulator [Sedimentisphaerales bacterium]